MNSYSDRACKCRYVCDVAFENLFFLLYINKCKILSLRAMTEYENIILHIGLGLFFLSSPNQ